MDEPGRKTRDSDLLQTHGVSDVDPGASVGVHIEWDHVFGPMPIILLARARQNTDADRGAQVDLRLSAGACRHLHSDAAEQRASNDYASAGLAYHF